MFASIPEPKALFANKSKPLEVGMVFRVNVPGFATAIRFFKATGDSGLHVGHLWSNTGGILASITFRGESAKGWQEATFDLPVALKANTSYVVSYFSPGGSYSFTQGFFSREVRSAGLTVPVDAGRLLYSPQPGQPIASFRQTNYWVDPVFTAKEPPDVPLSLSPRFPMPGGVDVGLSPRVAAVFSRRMAPESITNTNVQILGPGGDSVRLDIEYRPSTRELFLRTRWDLLANTTYAVRVSLGVRGPRDAYGNPLEKQVRWSFSTGAKPHAAGDSTGPILLLTSAARPFSSYLSEILLAEGLNEFRVVDIDRLSPELLQTTLMAVLGDIPVTQGQMSVLSTWVKGGGKLLGMRPDRRYDSLYGIKHEFSTLSDAYLRIDTSQPPGSGLTGETMQFHGISDVCSLAGATSLATLYSDAGRSTGHPAVTWFREGKGISAAFSFDLARSIVLTRQGNSAWSGMERDGVSPIRPDDLFFGSSDPKASKAWLDFAKVQIPQADELQRLFANLILKLTLPDQPLPRFWYLPRGLKAAVVMTGDDHGKGNTVNRFDNLLAASAPNCSLENWECVRASAYLFPGSLTSEQAKKFAADGFDIGVHVNTECADWPSQNSAAQMGAVYHRQLSGFENSYPDLPKPKTSRTHCIAWGDYDTQPRVESELGIRLDTNYYYWPQQWIQDRPGLFTGSGMPMRFATRTGNLIDVYQAPTFLTDESGQTYPLHIDTLLDNALGPRGYYGAFTANMHADLPESPQAEAILSSAFVRNVPVISAKQLLDWVDARNGSWFDERTWSAGKLSFSVSTSAGAYGLQVMLPLESSMGHLTALSREEKSVAYTKMKIKGIDYCVFSALSGRFVAKYRRGL